MGRKSKPAERVGWTTVAVPNRTDSGVQLRLRPDTKHSMRIIHNPKRIFRYYFNNRSAITDDPIASPMHKAYPEVRPHPRYAQIVLDRDDCGRVKIIEFPESLFLQLAQLGQDRGFDPGGISAPDVIVTVQGLGICTRYSVKCSVDYSPLTNDEKTRVRRFVEMGYDLESVFYPSRNIPELLGLL